MEFRTNVDNRHIEVYKKNRLNNKVTPNDRKINVVSKINRNRYTNKIQSFGSDKSNINGNAMTVNNKIIYDEIYTKTDDLAATNLEMHKRHLRSLNDMENIKKEGAKRVRRGTRKDPRCELFSFNEKDQSIIHPHPTNVSNANYYGSIECDIVIRGKIYIIHTL